MQVTLTEREISALLYALDIANASFDGYDPQELVDVKQDMKAWNRIEAKLYK